MNAFDTKSIKLKKLASIRAGYSLRKAIKPVDDGNVRLIQIKDIDQTNRINCDLVLRTQIDDIKPEHILRQGDILLRARGANRQAALFDMAQVTCLAAPQFLIISVNDPRVSPEYIYWYINQKPAQSFLSKNAVGTNIPNIPAKALADLPIAIPSLEKQRTIAALNRAVIKEQILLTQKIQNSRTMLNAIAQQMAKAK